MVSSVVDLTEHHDFSHPDLGAMDNVFIPDKEEFLTPEEYDEYLNHSRFFGKSRHTNEKYEIFGFTKFKHKNFVHICRWCGKEIKIPWRRYCKHCETDPKTDSIGSILPWDYGMASSTISNITREIFDLK